MELHNLGSAAVDEAASQASTPTTFEDAPKRPTAAANEQRPFQDLPRWIWRLFFASWLALFASFALIFGVSGGVRFVLGVVAAFAAVFFLTPLVLLRLTRRARRTQTGGAGRRIDLLYGRCSEAEAAIQIVLLPLALTIGLILIGLFVPR